MIGPTKLCPQGMALVVLDLDNTILVDGAIVTARVLDVIAQLRRRGGRACVATGRAWHMVPAQLRQPQSMDYLVCANGAQTYAADGSLIDERLMDREQALRALDAIAPLRPGWNAFVGDGAYFEWRGISYLLGGRAAAVGEGPQLARSSSRLRSLPLLIRRAARFGRRLATNREGLSQVWRVRPYLERMDVGVAKLGCSLPSPEACRRAIDILAHLGGFELARMGATELEITAAGVTKGQAIKPLMGRLGIDASCVVGFGDSENDRSLVDTCGTFVAMGNGDGDLKRIADDVCESVYDDGVARWLERAMAETNGVTHV